MKSQSDTGSLLRIIQDPATLVQDRVAAGNELAEINDPRLGVGLRDDGTPDIAWIDMWAGKFIFGNPDRNAFGGPRKTDLSAFRIARYPITHCQFQAFVDADDGYRNPDWWNGLSEIGLRQRSEGPLQPEFPYANRPRENVSWYEAMAFCAWLSTRLGILVTLPTEQQWEKAARGLLGRLYPYGNDFDPTKANTMESGIHETSAVGVFIAGASPYSIHDMSGNVWEWTSTEYATGRRGDRGSCEPRVLRGGAWDSNQHLARATYRNHYELDSRFNFIGFRVVSQSIQAPKDIPYRDVL
jgi:formylglycine-generating enzyme required for sulfatase activity